MPYVNAARSREHSLDVNLGRRVSDTGHKARKNSVTLQEFALELPRQRTI
jgi:hypothetical protein